MLTDFDRRLMQSRKWRLQAVDLRRHGPQRGTWFVEGIRSKVYKQFFEAGLRTVNVAARCYVRGLGRLTALAAAESADWYIAHTQAALPAASAAAQRWNARLGFDCEDLLAESGTDPSDIVRLIEKRYLPQCDYVSAPSNCIASRLKQDYGIRSTLVLYNVFPLHLADGLVPPEQRPSRSVLRVHWFGQTIGPGRGIEEAVDAIGMIGKNVELHLRGRVSEEYRAAIEAQARRKNVISNIVFHPVVHHNDLVGTMDQFDIGLALERLNHRNYSHTVTNKIFVYLLAGLCVAATDTPGQQEVLEQIPSVGFLCPAGNPQALADGLRRWMRNPDDLRSAQQAAWDTARKRFCWDIEKEKLLQVIQSGARKTLEE
jgi:glycosyltransferase involved in cell wall biosynthesis